VRRARRNGDPRYDDYARRFLTWWRTADRGDGLEEADIRRGARQLGLPRVLGAGSARIVFDVGSNALKIGGAAANRTEAQVWATAPPDIRAHLVPVRAIADDGAWLLVEKVRQRDGVSMSMSAYDLLTAYGIRDVTDANTAADGRLLDYGMVAPALRANGRRRRPVRRPR
jgi:hypothetical protein